MAERPTAAFILSLLGAIFYLIGGLGVAAIASIALIIPIAGLAIFAIGLVGIVSGVIMLIGAAMMNSSDKGRVRTGSVLVLVFLLIGAIFTIGGLFIGFLLALIGSIIGLTWNPTTPPMQAAPVPMQPISGMKYCPNCGTQTIASAAFCPKCGAKL
jgi:zinc-ribbon domain